MHMHMHNLKLMARLNPLTFYSSFEIKSCLEYIRIFKYLTNFLYHLLCVSYNTTQPAITNQNQQQPVTTI